ncbi:Rho GTPase-activating protein 1 [Stylosanthes scabra]|uniref:Rho GTPase-activating protein 1 n=1 Tax=Stylosanthes scabra TaxID=79078 RepID=A0ABU6U767_9FABA|nr:Rho GTPase-activating protein 1 [Stylosanthes scabra]
MPFSYLIHSSNLKPSSLFTLPLTMNIGSPTNVRHVAHVTFDRFNGFLGLTVEFEPEVPRRPPSASATVFGVSTDSMQLSYDSRGNSVPTILLLMQSRLYSQGGLQAEGIFRINADNSQEEYVREQLNLGVVPETVDVHSLAALIKAWFRELPTGVLDSLSQDQVLKCQTEEDCTELVRHLPHTEASLLDWAINLMADVVEYEHLNKMNARNVAMVFAPNMTQMADPITALMYAVQVMNFLKTLILRTLRERKDSVVEPSPRLYLEPFRSCLELPDENLDHTLLESSQQDTAAQNEEEVQKNSASEEIFLECCPESPKNKSEANNSECSSENQVSNESLYCDYPPKGNMGKSNKSGQSSSSNARKGSKKSKGLQAVTNENVSRSEQIKPWR